MGMISVTSEGSRGSQQKTHSKRLRTCQGIVHTRAMFELSPAPGEVPRHTVVRYPTSFTGNVYEMVAVSQCHIFRVVRHRRRGTGQTSPPPERERRGWEGAGEKERSQEPWGSDPL